VNELYDSINKELARNHYQNRSHKIRGALISVYGLEEVQTIARHPLLSEVGRRLLAMNRDNKMVFTEYSLNRLWPVWQKPVPLSDYITATDHGIEVYRRKI
jgi:hypothetical protein